MNETLLKVAKLLDINISSVKIMAPALAKQQLIRLIANQLSSFTFKGAFGGGLLSLPIYKIVAMKKSVRVAKKVMRRIFKILVIIVGLAFFLKYGVKLFSPYL